MVHCPNQTPLVVCGNYQDCKSIEEANQAGHLLLKKDVVLPLEGNAISYSRFNLIISLVLDNSIINGFKREKTKNKNHHALSKDDLSIKFKMGSKPSVKVLMLKYILIFCHRRCVPFSFR